MSRDDRIVFDTNCLISSFIKPDGKVGTALKKGIQNYTLVFSPQTLAELWEVIQRDKFREFDLSDRLVFANGLRDSSSIHEQTHEATECIDPKDNKFLSIAVSCGARYLITGDKGHLQSMGRYYGVEILSPSRFLEREAERDKQRPVAE